MKFTTAIIASSVAALAAASPIEARDITYGTYKIVAHAPGTDFDGLPLQAMLNSIVIGAENQNASCGPDPRNYATFVFPKPGYTKPTELALYTANPTQTFYADLSGMAQGIIKYTTGAQPAPGEAQRDGFTRTAKNTLVWTYPGSKNTVGFQACGPVRNAKYSVWVDAFTNPAGYTGCKKFTARFVEEPLKKAEKCWYSDSD